MRLEQGWLKRSVRSLGMPHIYTCMNNTADCFIVQSMCIWTGWLLVLYVIQPHVLFRSNKHNLRRIWWHENGHLKLENKGNSSSQSKLPLVQRNCLQRWHCCKANTLTSNGSGCHMHCCWCLVVGLHDQHYHSQMLVKGPG